MTRTEISPRNAVSRMRALPAGIIAGLITAPPMLYGELFLPDWFVAFAGKTHLGHLERMAMSAVCIGLLGYSVWQFVRVCREGARK